MDNEEFYTIGTSPNFKPNLELQFVDDDIRKAFEGTSYLIGTPTNVQLARNIKELSEKLDKLNAK